MANGRQSCRFIAVVLVAACFTTLAVAPLQSAGSGGEGLKFALLVGVSDYDPVCTYGDLTYSHKDALDMFDLLVNGHGWTPSNILVLLNESATAENILSGISWLESECSNPRSTALLFFSGHGSFFCNRAAIPDRDEPVDECIMPHDGNPQTSENIIFDDTMGDLLDLLKPARVILVLDSCYSGGFIKETGSEGTMVLTSCGEREMCWEGMDTGKVQVPNGLYTHCLLEAFGGAGDKDGDGRVSVEEAGGYAMDRVRDFTPDVQPEMFDGVEGDTYI